ncbi:ABC transporter ATP-binding protein [Salinibacterium sp. dk2585]|uniref:metal ABC transporter ATP-binding protein n=1 Tax=unclassified Salinibacterium TaxID=2632331 RepID=UPI0011C24438|nr:MULTISPECIES: ABC transporter ATP-binding protein [unclassified Salinibacterium]QEE60151.1 ABC transporter ATP-binding protein [Salinibacterium sp. dk2585]TXK55223.1 ABC transporter ATP-binding protein [Salinibacterium sp. dk5596]
MTERADPAASAVLETSKADTPVLSLRSATLAYGDRVLWKNLNLEVKPGEFLAVLGSNGTGKTSLLKAILGQQQLSSGSIELLGEPVRRGHRGIGYIPQQRLIEQGTPLRARDLVTLGINGHRWGLPVTGRRTRQQVDRVLESVGATSFANVPVATLSGGEQQRIRVGQAIASNPALLLCDEPLSSLDLNHQRVVSDLIDERRRAIGSAVVFVTHDINPVLDKVDRVLYLAGGRFRIGTPDEVLRSEVLSYMYNTPIEVIRTRGRVAVLGAPEGYGVHDHLEHHIDDRWQR